MKRNILKFIPLYKLLLVIVILNGLTVILFLIFPSRKTNALCLTVLVVTSLIIILGIVIPLHKQHKYFLHHHTLSDEQIPSDDADSELINSFLTASHKKARLVESTLSDQNIDYLSKQINSHFFYNTLDSIRGRAICDGADLVADMVETLSAFFRYSISRKGNIVSIQDELQNLNSYMKIQMFRFGSRIQYAVSLDSDKITNFQIPKLTLQPIVENSIVHGIEHYESGGSIAVNMYETDSTIVIHVKDNGVGIPTEKLDKINYHFQNNYFESSELQKKHMNIALNNINNRICLLHGNKYHLHIFSTENLGTDVQITLPKLLNSKEV